MSIEDIMNEYAGRWPEGISSGGGRTVTQGYINGHLVRVNSGGKVIQYWAVVGLNAALGNTHLNKKYKEIVCKPLFNTALEAWTYGCNIAKGASPTVRND